MKIDIIVLLTRTDKQYEARIKDDALRDCGVGQSAAEAVGNLVCKRQEYFRTHIEGWSEGMPLILHHTEIRAEATG